MRRILTSLAAVALLAGCATASHPAASHVAQLASATPSPAATIPGPPPSPSPSPARSHPPRACGTSLWRHIYHPDRLSILQLCKTVHGTVEAVRHEPDGDLHILLATRHALVNSVNDSEQHGDLVLEEICQEHVTQADAISACQGVPHNLTIPAVGDRVTVTGSYVLDQDHGWMEIHPVTSLTDHGQAAPAPAPAPSTAAAAPAGCHPTTPSGNCYEPGEFCSEAEHGETGVAGDGKTITCSPPSSGSTWRWV